MQSLDLSWWDVKAQDAHTSLLQAAKAIDALPQEAERQTAISDYSRAFENTIFDPIVDFGGQMGPLTPQTMGIGGISTWNVLRSVVMTAASMIGSSRPRAKFLTTGGNYLQKRRARQATDFCDGWAAEHNLYALTYQCLIDSLIMDFGCIQVYEENGKVKVQRVLASEIRVDPTDGFYGSPRTIYRKHLKSKDVLRAMYKTAKSAVKEAIEVAPTTTNNMVVIYEAWHLPSGPDAEDGVHAAAIEGALLFHEEYTKDRFPLIFLRWEDALAGFSGRSLASQLYPMQIQLDILLETIQMSQEIMSVPRIFAPRASKLVKSHISNDIGAIIEYSGLTPPTAMTWQAMSSEVYQWVNTQVQKMYDLPGISRNVASGTKEPGLSSGKAIMESLEVQTQRMKTYQQRWETFHIKIYETVVELASDIVSDGNKYEVSAPTKKALSKLDWKKIKLDKDEYTIQVFPVSKLPISPEGRIETVTSLLNAGVYSLEWARQALEDLDLESANDLDLATNRLLERQFEGMLYEGKPAMPDEFTDLATAIRLGTQYLAMGLNDECPEEHIELMRRYLSEAKRMQAAAAPPPAEAPPAAA